DMQMPVMGGMEATKTLREMGYSGPIVALTANAMKGEKNQSIAEGFNDYLTRRIDHRLYPAMRTDFRTGRRHVLGKIVFFREIRKFLYLVATYCRTIP